LIDILQFKTTLTVATLRDKQVWIVNDDQAGIEVLAAADPVNKVTQVADGRTGHRELLHLDATTDFQPALLTQFGEVRFRVLPSRILKCQAMSIARQRLLLAHLQREMQHVASVSDRSSMDADVNQGSGLEPASRCHDQPQLPFSQTTTEDLVDMRPWRRHWTM